MLGNWPKRSLFNVNLFYFGKQSQWLVLSLFVCVLQLIYKWVSILTSYFFKTGAQLLLIRHMTFVDLGHVQFLNLNFQHCIAHLSVFVQNMPLYMLSFVLCEELQFLCARLFPGHVKDCVLECDLCMCHFNFVYIGIFKFLFITAQEVICKQYLCVMQILIFEEPVGERHMYVQSVCF